MTMPHEDAPRPSGQAPGTPDGQDPAQPTPPGPEAAPPAQPAPSAPQQPTGWGDPPTPAGWGPPPGQPSGWGPPPGQQPGGWQQPGYGQPAYGQPSYGQPTYGQPSYGQPGGPAPAPYGPAGWRPPALQPGIIPLRPLGVGEILDGAFRSIRANPRVMFGLAVIVVSIVVVIQAVLTWYLGGLLSGAITDFSVTADPGGELGLDQQVGSMLGVLLSMPLLLVATTVLTGLLIVSVSRSVIGQTITLGDAIRASRRRVWWVVGITLLYLTVIALGYAALVGLFLLTAVNEQWVLFAVTGIVGGLLLLAATVWLSVRMLLVTPALMLEGGAFWATVRRGWKLTRGSFWRLFGIYLLVQVIMSVVVGIIAVPIAIIAAVFLDDPLMITFGGIALSSIGDIISYTLTTVFSAAVAALLYIDVRMRREGLDVELARAAEQTPA